MPKVNAMNIHHLLFQECSASYNGTPPYVPGDGETMEFCQSTAFA